MRRSWLASMIIAAGLSARAAFGQEAPPESAPADVPQLPAFKVVTPADQGAPPAKEVKAPPQVQPMPVYSAPEGPCKRVAIYGSAEYLLWWMKKGNVPPLVTQGDPADIPSGALGQPGTSNLFGGGRVGPNTFNGGRFTLGLALDREQIWGIEGSYFFLATRHTSFTAANDATGTRTLNVPFFNADGGFEDANQIAIPGAQSGTVSVTTSQRLMGYEINLRKSLADTGAYRIGLLVGFRYLSLEESLDLSASFDAVPLAFGVSSAFNDSFATRNRFYGGQIGITGETNRDRWLFGAQAKVALGSVNQRVSINGSTTNTDPINGTVTTPGGLFSAPSNMGEFSRNRFAVVPEVGLNLGYQLTRSLTATVGYNFLYVSSVVRPGDQIDRSINFGPPANGVTRPTASFNSTDFWTQGVSLGLQFRF